MDRKSIVEAVDLEVVPVQVPEWGGTVHLRAFSGIERDLVSEWYKEHAADDYKGLREYVCALALCDESGRLLFTTEPADLEILRGKSATVLETLMDKALSISGLGADATEEAAKN
jgi:hypothetical protein